MKIKKFAVRLIFLFTLIQVFQVLSMDRGVWAAARIFNVSVNGMTLIITPTIPNQTYTNVGIKLDSSAYTLAYIGSECTMNSNGYCLFTASNLTPKNITISGSVGSLALTLCLNGKGPLSCQQHTVTIAPSMSFSGIRTDLTETEVLQGGFSQCYNALYSSALDTTASVIKTPCTGNVILVTCRPVGATTYTVAAMALRSDVFLPVAANSTSSHNSNGTQWYYSDSYSFGFAAIGATLSRTSCDTYTAAESATRLCWHTNGYAGGYRCGATLALNASTLWERRVYHRNGSV